jgi:hypothetical protein
MVADVKGMLRTMPVVTLDDPKEAPLPRVVAEALVWRMSQPEVIERAKAEGLPEPVVATAVRVCGCGKQQTSQPGTIS